MKILQIVSLFFIFDNLVSSEVNNSIYYSEIRNVSFEEKYASQVAHKIYNELKSWYFTLVSVGYDNFENFILKSIENFDDGFPVMMSEGPVKGSEDKIDVHGRTTYIVSHSRLSLKLLDELITTLKNVRTWKPRSSVAFVLKLPVNTTKYFMYDLKRHFDLLWSRRMVNTILILWSTRLKVYTFNPFTDEVMDISDMTGIKDILRNKFRDMNGYPLRVTLFHKIISSNSSNAVSCDNFLVSAVIKYLNARCVALKPRDGNTVGVLRDNGSATGATADLLAGYSDIELSSRILRLHYYGHIDTTYPLTQDDLIFLVPKGTKQDSFTAVLKLIPPMALLVFISILIATIILGLFIRKLEKKWFGIPHRHCTGSVAMDLLKCFLRQSVIILFSGVAFRTIVFAIQIYSLVVNCAIDGVLTTAITYPTFYPDMDTLEELASSNYKIIIRSRHIDIVVTNLAPALTGRAEGLTEEKVKELLEAKITDMAYLMRKSEATYVSRQKKNIVNGRQFYHRLSESAIPCLIVYGLRHGSPYLPRVNRAMSMLSESGILSYWSRVSSYSLYNEGKKILYEGSTKEKSPLDMDNTQGLFYVWIAGVALSSVVFAFELFCSALVDKLNNLALIF